MIRSMVYDPEQVLMAARFLAQNNNVGIRNQNREAQDWYDDILNNARFNAKKDIGFFATGGYLILFDSSDENVYIEVYVEPNLSITEESVYQHEVLS